MTSSAIIQPADWAAVPMGGPRIIGKLVEFGQWANGDGWAPYEHVLGYAGYFPAAPPFSGPCQGSGKGHYVIEAMPGGARLRRLAGGPEDIQGAVWSSGHYDISLALRDKLLSTAIFFLNTPYSALDYFALATHRLHLHPLDNVLRDRVASSKHMICSQFWDRVYGTNGIQLFDDKRWDGDVTPLDMAELVLPH